VALEVTTLYLRYLNLVKPPPSIDHFPLAVSYISYRCHLHM